MQNVSAIKPVLENIPKKEEINQKVSQAEKEIKDGKKKLALTLTGLATAGIATVGIIMAVKKGKTSELSFDDFKKVGNFDKGKAFVKGKPYTGIIDVVNSNGKYQLEYAKGTLKSSTKLTKNSQDFIEQFQKAGLTGKKYEYSTKMKKLYSGQDGIKAIEKQTFNPHTGKWKTSSKTIIQDGNITQTTGELQRVAQKQNDGTWKVTKQEIRDIHGRGYAINTIDVKSGEVVSTKVAGTYKGYKKDNGGLLRKTVEEVDNAGNKVINNYRNGSLYSTTKTTIQPDGTKRIVVEYSKTANKEGQTIIEIAKDGTRKVVQEAKEDLFRM